MTVLSTVLGTGDSTLTARDMANVLEEFKDITDDNKLIKQGIHQDI